MAKAKEGLIWLLDLCRHTRWDIDSGQLAEVINLIYVWIRKFTATIKWTAEDLSAGDSIKLCLADPTPEACKEILQFAETFCSGLTVGLQEIVQEELQLALPEVSFNQILFLGRFAVKENGHVYSKELNLVVKTVKNAVTNTPNVTISDDLVKRLPDPERTLKKYEYDLLPTEMLEDNAHDLGAFHSLMPPIEETTRELAKEGLVFGVIPDIGTVLYRETDIRHIISILQKERCCHVTGLYGVGKTAVGIGILKELAKSGVSCLWFNCWKLLSFEYLTHVVAHIFGRLGEDSSFVIESLKYVDPEAGWEERFGILLRALASAQREFCIILDNFNSLDLDSHTRKFFDFAADYLLSGSTLLGKLSIVYITTRGHSGYRQIPEGQFPPKVTHTIEGLPANKLMNCLKEYFPDINLDLADTLVTYVTQNLKLLKMLCGHITSKHMDPNSVLTRMRNGRDNGSGCDHFLFSWLYEQLDEQEQNEMRFAVQFRPLFSAELLASIVKKEKWKCRKSLEELSRQLCCLERYECEGREEWLYKTLYRVPPEFQEEVVSDDDKPSAGLIEKAADFFVADVKDIQIPRAKIREYYFRIYRAYRYAVFFIGEAGDRLKHFELAKRFWSVLIENGVVAELRNDLKECQEAVGKHGKLEQKVDMYMMWNRLWRILFRMELYKKNLQEMQKFLSDLPKRERLPYFTNSYQVEQGIYLTMLRDYASALPIFKRRSLGVLRSYDATRISRKPIFRAVTSAIGKLTGYGRRDRSSKMEIKNERILYTLRLRTAQTLISLNRPLEAKTLLKSFEFPDQIWSSLAEWHSTDLKDIEHIWYELLDGYILRHHGSEGFPTQDTYLGIMSSRLDELYAKLKNEVSSERDRTVLHSLAMFMRHHTTLYFLEYKGKEALISSLLCYMFNDQILGDQTGRGICLLQMAKILQKLFPPEKALKLADAIIDQAIQELCLRSQSLWWLACAYWTKARIAIACSDIAKGKYYAQRMSEINKLHDNDTWRKYEAQYLHFLCDLQEERTSDIEMLYNKIIANNSSWNNSYFRIDGEIEYGHYCLNKGKRAKGLEAIGRARELYKTLWGYCPSTE